MKEEIFTEINFSRLKNLINNSEAKNKIFMSSDDDLNRKVMEKLEIHTLLINLIGRKDFQKQRDSGFNQVMSKIAKEKGIVIGINLDEILESSGSLRAEILARVRQNIMLCNKKKINMRFISVKGVKKDKHDLKSLGAVLGMPTWMS